MNKKLIWGIVIVVVIAAIVYIVNVNTYVATPLRQDVTSEVEKTDNNSVTSQVPATKESASYRGSNPNMSGGLCPEGQVYNGTACESASYRGANPNMSGGKYTNLVVISPNGGESLSVGKTYEIKWNAPANSTQIRISLTDDRTGSRQAEPLLIVGNVSAQAGKYSWTVPSTIIPNKVTDKGTFKILIEENSLRGYTDESDNYFNITN